MQLKYPRAIHAEVLTHRVFSRNSSSSRAEPVKKNIERMRADGFPFVHVGKNQPGMQSREEVDPETRGAFEREWQELGNTVAIYVERWAEEYGVHKQVANRALEPWSHIHVVLSSTEWENFFSLRAHDDAQPEMQALAIAMRGAMDQSSPTLMRPGQWHLPYVHNDERRRFPLADLLKFSAARCARVSYIKHDGKVPMPEDDLKLFERLVGAAPIHASPTEHQAVPDAKWLGFLWWKHRKFHGNFNGWIQHRKLIEGGLYEALLTDMAA